MVQTERYQKPGKSVETASSFKGGYSDDSHYFLERRYTIFRTSGWTEPPAIIQD